MIGMRLEGAHTHTNTLLHTLLRTGTALEAQEGPREDNNITEVRPCGMRDTFKHRDTQRTSETSWALGSPWKRDANTLKERSRYS